MIHVFLYKLYTYTQFNLIYIYIYIYYLSSVKLVCPVAFACAIASLSPIKGELQTKQMRENPASVYIHIIYISA